MTRKTSAGLTAAIFLIAVLFVAWELTREKAEPVWNGRSLSAWTEDLATGSSKEIREEAENAIRHIGPSGIPYLLQMLRSRDTVLGRAMVGLGRELNRRQSAKVFGVISTQEKYDRAVLALEALGPMARPAIPELKKELIRHPLPVYVADALSAIGPEAVTAILECLPKLAPEKRCDLYYSAASKWPSQAPAIIQALLQSIRSPNADERRCAAEFLGRFRQNPSVTVPVLISTLRDPELEVRAQALDSLAQYGTNASTAIDPLRQLLNLGSRLPPQAISNALARIQPAN